MISPKESKCKHNRWPLKLNTIWCEESISKICTPLVLWLHRSKWYKIRLLKCITQLFTINVWAPFHRQYRLSHVHIHDNNVLIIFYSVDTCLRTAFRVLVQKLDTFVLNYESANAPPVRLRCISSFIIYLYQRKYMF